MIRRFLIALFGCAHDDLIRERRLLGKVSVLHFVCDRCGHAVPAVDRTLAEHKRIVKVGTPITHKARRTVEPAEVVPFGKAARK